MDLGLYHLVKYATSAKIAVNTAAEETPLALLSGLTKACMLRKDALAHGSTIF